jgi:hypothetical protein
MYRQAFMQSVLSDFTKMRLQPPAKIKIPCTKASLSMSNIRITKQFTETGHALYGYDGKCKTCIITVTNFGYRNRNANY